MANVLSIACESGVVYLSHRLACRAKVSYQAWCPPIWVEITPAVACIRQLRTFGVDRDRLCWCRYGEGVGRRFRSHACWTPGDLRPPRADRVQVADDRQ